MTKQLKRMTMASSVALALALPASAYAIQGVHFDPDGAPGGSPVQIVSTFDWGPAQVLYKDCFGSAGVGGAGCVIHAQGATGSVVLSTGGNLVIPAGVTYTFILKTVATTSLPGGSLYNGVTPAIGETILVGGGLDPVSIFEMWTQPAVPAQLTGVGYSGGAGTLMLGGKVTVQDFALTNTATATQNLDQFGVNDWVGLLTRSTSGSPAFTINVDFLNPLYFTDPISTFDLQLSDIDQSDNSISPFKNANPSASIAGQAFAVAAVGDGATPVSDIYCQAKGTTTCSGQFQGDAASTFLTNVVPEPGMLALLGVGLAGLGVFSRRRRSLMQA